MFEIATRDHRHDPIFVNNRKSPSRSIIVAIQIERRTSLPQSFSCLALVILRLSGTENILDLSALIAI
jgi:hypothetical protein